MLPLSAVPMAAVAVFKYSPISPILSPLPPACVGGSVAEWLGRWTCDQ